MQRIRLFFTSSLRISWLGVSKTLGCLAGRLSAGKSSPVMRETASSVYHVVEGRGHSEIEGKKFKWRKSDTFCVPAWCEYRHYANTAEAV
jgi:gentisate 1,2-dioxygenase